ncbi:hypothetical protein ACE6H2_016796 [Prunus campanulata]
MRRRATSKRVQRELDEQLGIAVALLEEENQSRRGSREGRRPNMDRHRHSRGKNLLEDYFIPQSLYSDVDFRRRYRMQPHLFNKIMHDICNYDEYFVQKKNAAGNLGLLPEQKFTAVIRILQIIYLIAKVFPTSMVVHRFCQGISPFRQLFIKNFPPTR